MKITTIFTSTMAMGLLTLALCLNTGCNQNEVASDTVIAKAMATSDHDAMLLQEELVKRGAYLVTIMGCDDCHTPKKMTEHGPAPDMARRLMGYPAEQKLPKLDPGVVAHGEWAAFNGDLTAAVGPWGVSFAANLTPDPTGIGFWTEDNFIKAIREGKLKGIEGSRPLLPPMPWPNYAQASDDDLQAIFAYLKSIKPIKNVVPSPIQPDQLSSLQ